MAYIDQNNDPAHTHLFHLLKENPSVHAFVKTANLTDGKNLPDSAFAWPEKRLFPVDSPESTALSSLYREKCASIPASVDSALQKAQELYGVKDLLERDKQFQKTASAEEAAVEASTTTYLLPEHKRLRVTDGESVKKAEALLLRDYKRLSIEDRATAFTNLVKAASVCGVTPHSKSMQMAGLYGCNVKEARDWIEARRIVAPKYDNAYTKLASVFVQQGQDVIVDRDELLSAVDALTELDKVAGVTPFYDKKLPDPIRTVFNMSKRSEVTVHVAGRDIPISLLETKPLTWWEDIVGKDIAKDFENKTGEELRSLVKTLPLDLKLIVKNQA